MIKINCAHDAVVDIGDLVPHPENPNKHPDKQIELFGLLLREHGWRMPICVSNQTGYIVRGHLRYLTALKLDQERVPVDFQDYDSGEMEIADLMADNRIPEMAERDEQLLSELLTKIKEAPDVDIEITGYTDQDLDKMRQGLEKKKKEAPEVEFSEELHESSNYIVLYFDNDIDWLQALTLFDLKTVKALDSKEGFQKQGIGRVLSGSEALNKIMGE